jgi:DNA repair protein RadA/Sms
MCHFRRPSSRGNCPSCGFWANVKQVGDGDDIEVTSDDDGEVLSLCDVKTPDVERISTGIPTVDAVLGVGPDGKCGFAPDAGQIAQLYGQAGSGKTTLLLIIAAAFARQRLDVLYIAGEESIGQIKGNADRINLFRGRKSDRRLRIVSESDIDNIADKIEESECRIAIVDSLNTVEVEDYRPGSLVAIESAARDLIKLGKSKKIGIILVVQLTKAGDFAGPESLRHAIDTDLFMVNSGEQRVLRCHIKNRFGNVPSEAHFWMTPTGLKPIHAPQKEPEPATEPRQTEAEPLPAPPAKTLRKRAPRSPRAPLPTDVDTILAVDCEQSDCKGRGGKGCTAADGTPEAGFHESRILLARKVKRPGGGK